MAQAVYTPPTTAAAAPGADIADPAPLGLSGFALTTFVLSSVNAGWFDPKGEPVVVGLALFYGGIVQVLAGMWEFKKANTFGATAFSSYGGFWLALATFFIIQKTALAVPADQAATAVGFFLIGWTIFTGIMTIASFRLNGALIVVFVLLFLTFLALSIGQFNPPVSSSGWHTLGGYLGLLTAVAAFYAALAGVTKFTFKREVLPVWPVR